MNTVNVLVWNEGIDEKTKPEIAEHYPDGIGGALRRCFCAPQFRTAVAGIADPECGLTTIALERADVIVWWSHSANHAVPYDLVDRLQQRVLSGTGLVVLHSAHLSRVFRRLMGTNCRLKWRESGEREKLWVVAPRHPIAEGLPECIELEQEEMYGEPFEIPAPEELVFVSWFEGGEVFRSGCCYTRGRGRVFYFRPGHEAHGTYNHPHIQMILRNAATWAARVVPTVRQLNEAGN
jgi:trehalose utilization protein